MVDWAKQLTKCNVKEGRNHALADAVLFSVFFFSFLLPL